MMLHVFAALTALFQPVAPAQPPSRLVLASVSASLDGLQRRVAVELIIEYAASAVESAASLRIGTRVPGGVVRAIGLERVPRQ
jgi:hypothetical protein